MRRIAIDTAETVGIWRELGMDVVGTFFLNNLLKGTDGSNDPVSMPLD